MCSVLFLPSHPPLLYWEQECQYILKFYLGEFNSPWIFVFWKIANFRKIGEIEFTLEPSGCGFTILTDFFSLSLSLCTSLNFSTEFLKEDCRHHHTYSVYFNIKKKKLREYSVLSRASHVAQLWRIRLPMQEMKVLSLGWEDPLQKEMATLASILAWKIQWTEEPGGLQSMGSQ